VGLPQLPRCLWVEKGSLRLSGTKKPPRLDHLLWISPCPSHPGISDISGQQRIETLALATILSEAKVLGSVVLVRTPTVSREG